MPIDWGSAAERWRLAERVGPAEYNKLLDGYKRRAAAQNPPGSDRTENTPALQI
jgi:hypothetical protein